MLWKCFGGKFWFQQQQQKWEQSLLGFVPETADFFSWKKGQNIWEIIRGASLHLMETGIWWANIRPLSEIGKLNCFPNLLAKVQNQQYISCQGVDTPPSIKLVCKLKLQTNHTKIAPANWVCELHRGPMIVHLIVNMPSFVKSLKSVEWIRVRSYERFCCTTYNFRYNNFKYSITGQWSNTALQFHCRCLYYRP